mgnify:CR=1 FL=1
MKTLILILTVFSVNAQAQYQDQAAVTLEEMTQKHQIKPVGKKALKKPATKVEVKPEVVPYQEMTSQLQFSLGYSKISVTNDRNSDETSVPSLGVSLKGMAMNGSGVDVGLKFDLAYGKQDERNAMLASAMGEIGYRFYLTNSLSFAPHVILGGAYLDYENKTQSFNQVNEVKGMVGVGGVNVDVQLALKQMSLGLKLEYTSMVINMNTESKARVVTPSLVLQIPF